MIGSWTMCAIGNATNGQGHERFRFPEPPKQPVGEPLPLRNGAFPTGWSPMSNRMRWVDDSWLYTTRIYSLSGHNGPIRARFRQSIVCPLTLFEWSCRTYEMEQGHDWYVYPVDQPPVLVAFEDLPYPFIKSPHRVFSCDLVTLLNGTVYRVMGVYVPKQR